MLSTEFLNIWNPQQADETLNRKILSKCVSSIQAWPCQGLQVIALLENWQSRAPYVSRSVGCQRFPGTANVCNQPVCRKSSFLFLFLDLCSLGLQDYRVLPPSLTSSIPLPTGGPVHNITNTVPVPGVAGGRRHFIRMCTPHPNLTFCTYVCVSFLHSLNRLSSDSMLEQPVDLEDANEDAEVWLQELLTG